jgi:hypothetical protein
MTILIFLQRLRRHVADLIAGVRDARLLAHRYKDLSHLTDAQLAARGLKREQIPQAVLNRKVRV